MRDKLVTPMVVEQYVSVLASFVVASNAYGFFDDDLWHTLLVGSRVRVHLERPDGVTPKVHLVPSKFKPRSKLVDSFLALRIFISTPLQEADQLSFRISDRATGAKRFSAT